MDGVDMEQWLRSNKTTIDELTNLADNDIETFAKDTLHTLSTKRFVKSIHKLQQKKPSDTDDDAESNTQPRNKQHVLETERYNALAQKLMNDNKRLKRESTEREKTITELMRQLDLKQRDLISEKQAHLVTSQKINTDGSDEDGMQFEYVLDCNDTFLHSTFGDTNSKRIKQIVDHKMTLIVLVILLVITTILYTMLGAEGEHTIAFNLYHITLYCLLFIPWIIFRHLLCNKVAFALCIRTFDYWIKVGHGCMLSIALLLHGTPSVTVFTLANIQECIFSVWSVLLISYISSFDAVHSTKPKRLITSVFAALVFSFCSIYFQCLMIDKADYKIRIQLSNGTSVVSMQSLITGSSRIIAIFMWKQSYKTWKSNERAVVISTAPKISWIDTTSTDSGQQKGDRTTVAGHPVAQYDKIEESDATLGVLMCRPHVNEGRVVHDHEPTSISPAAEIGTSDCGHIQKISVELDRFKSIKL